jgi:hypothetical protein
VDPLKIRRLYESDARGMLDEELLDDVGYGFYVRCRDSIELSQAAQGRVKCHGCGAIIERQLVDGCFDASEILRCDECGWEIAPRDYHKTLLRKRPAPPYEPMRVYRAFFEQWPLARTPTQKLLLIDRLIHEWHLHYVQVGWPLGTGVVKTTAKQMIELLEGLAYGPGSTDGLEQTRALWRNRRKAQEMPLDLKVAARDLGIEGANRMLKRELIEAIERVEPRFFDPWLHLIHGSERTD